MGCCRAQGADRQPGRDRRPGRPRLPGRRAGQRRRLRRPGPGRPARTRWPTRRSRWAGRPPADSTWTSTSCSTSPRGLRRGRGAPRLRLPGRERRVRPGGAGRRADLDRSAAGRDRALGDKVAARHIAAAGRRAAGARHRRPGQPAPTRSWPSPSEHGLPVAIKAAFGGGGRGLKVARTHRGDPGAVRVARCARRWPRSVAASASSSATWTGRGTSRRSAWPTSTATSWSSSHPGLLAAAPAPEAGRGGAGPVPDRRAATAELYRGVQGDPAPRPATSARAPCEFLVGADGTISFLEVNTRLQVEHPVTEEVTGIDLVREMFRIADGERARATTTRSCAGTPSSSGSTARTPGRSFLPAPGTVTGCVEPAGPGVRVDSGVAPGPSSAARVRLAARQADRHRRDPGSRRWSGPGGRWTSSSSTGCRPCCRSTARWCATRPSPRRAVPVHTRWIETEFAQRASRRTPGTPRGGRGARRAAERVVVEVGGRRLEVALPAGLGACRRRPAAGGRRRRRRAAARGAARRRRRAATR